MSSLYRNRKDKKIRQIVNHFEKKKNLYKFFIYNENFWERNERRFKLSQKLYFYPKDSSKTRIRNRCILSGRSRSVFRDYKLSRSFFKKMANKGKLIGISKASW